MGKWIGYCWRFSSYFWKAVVQHGAPSEDVKLPFSSVEGGLYVGFDFSVDDLGAPYSGSDNEYFTHLDFKARMDVVPPSGSGDYSVGISQSLIKFKSVLRIF